MSEVLLANLFFIITGLAVLVVGAFLCVALFHLIKMVKLARKVLERIESSAELIIEDIQTVRDQILSGSFLGRVFGAVMLATGVGKAKRTSPRKKKDVMSEE